MMPKKASSRTRRRHSQRQSQQAYGIECDLQITADGEAMVYHDDALGRLTEGSGTLDAMTAAELKTHAASGRPPTA